MTTLPKVTAFASWFGSNRMLAARVGVELGRCSWVGVPFMGGGSELLHINTRAGVASDLHRHVINLARVIRDRRLRRQLVRRLLLTPFHADELAGAQARCADREASRQVSIFGPAGYENGNAADLEWAFDYFVCCWMGASARAGASKEFSQYHAVRFTSSGGSSAIRYRSAAESLRAWGKVLERWEFVTDDAFEFLARVKSVKKPEATHGIYCDPPWVEAGHEYKFRFGTAQHRRLAECLSAMAPRRVVVRYGDDPLIRSLYPEDRWTWIEQTSRDQGNSDIREVLILNGPSFGAPQ